MSDFNKKLISKILEISNKIKNIKGTASYVVVSDDLIEKIELEQKILKRKKLIKELLK